MPPPLLCGHSVPLRLPLALVWTAGAAAVVWHSVPLLFGHSVPMWRLILLLPRLLGIGAAAMRHSVPQAWMLLPLPRALGAAAAASSSGLGCPAVDALWSCVVVGAAAAALGHSVPLPLWLP